MITILEPSKIQLTEWQNTRSTQPLLSRFIRHARPEELIPVGPKYAGRTTFSNMLIESDIPLDLYVKFDHSKYLGVMPIQKEGNRYLCTVDCIQDAKEELVAKMLAKENQG